MIGPAQMPEQPARYIGHARIRWADGLVDDVVVELVGGRSRHSVGGEIAEGFRWWHGQLGPVGVVIDLTAGTEVVLELEDGHEARAVVEPGAEMDATATIVVRGVGAPPFDVNGAEAPDVDT